MPKIIIIILIIILTVHFEDNFNNSIFLYLIRIINRCNGRRVKRRTLNPQHIYWSAQTTGNEY